MRTLLYLPILTTLIASNPAASEDHDSHAESDHHDHAFEFSEPLFQEKPGPCSTMRLDYFYLNSDEDGVVHSPLLNAGFTLTPNFGLEVAVPYRIYAREDNRFGLLHLALRAARFTDSGFAFGYGLGAGIPLQ
jgi:hypothetical protein